MAQSSRVAVYTGSFDPFHLGHEDIVRRAARLFEQVIVGVGENPDKRSLFSPTERVDMIREVIGDVSNVTVTAFVGLTVHFARTEGSFVLIRGIRALADIEYEFTMSLTNSSLDPQMETVFLMANKEFSHLSSSLIRQIAEFGGELHGFVPDPVMHRLKAKFQTNQPA